MRGTVAVFRLTLTRNALIAFPRIVKLRKFPTLLERADGKIDVLISMSLIDQLRTAANPGENLSDTVLRIAQTVEG